MKAAKLLAPKTKIGRALKIIKQLDKFLDDKYFLQTYCNGREQGFCLQCTSGPCFAFSEARGSDQIVVYKQDSMFDNTNGNKPSEAAYENAKYFDTESEAVDYIIDQIYPDDPA